MDVGPALGLLGLLFVKEAGVPIPVPGDLLVIGAGVAAAGSGPAGLLLLAAAVSASSGPVLGIVALVLLSIVGAVGWRWIRARRLAAGEPAALPSLGTGALADAACPACLAISLVGGSRS